MAIQLCWICGNPATTREHSAKRSDITAVFQDISQVRPVHFRSGHRSTAIGSADHPLLRWKSQLCAHCNNTLTQPYDRAWEGTSAFLRSKGKLVPKSCISLKPALPQNTTRRLLHLHLYFVKQLGCYLRDENLSFDLDEFASAVRGGRTHPDVYLKFSPGIEVGGQEQVGMTPLHCHMHNNNLMAATWIYTVGSLSVQTIFFRPDQPKMLMRNRAWHPRSERSRIEIENFWD